ncbi:MAG: hypothetical protein VST72_07885 [Nitrospirota bacterium]|nr:hypothetical protein [Nitrospirota bacterium]
MRKKIILSALTLLMLTVFATDGRCVGPGPDGPDRPPSREQMEKVRERIEAIKIWKMTKALNLDEKTAARLFPLMNRFDKERGEIQRKIRDGLKEIKDGLKDKDDRQLIGIMEKLEDYHRELQRLKDREWAELKGILTVEQQARFLVFTEEFQNEIRNIIARTKGRRFERMREGGR